MSKKVLIITYYWPPAGGGGVQRWLKFAKYLPEFGFTPVIYTPENPDYPVLDESLAQDIHPDTLIVRHPIWEPYRSFRKVAAGGDAAVSAGFIRSGNRESLKSRLTGWMRGNLIIPDARRFWIGPSIRFLCNYLKENPVDLIVSTGPPHSMHLIARGVSARMNIRWLADFRDPWVNMDNLDKFRMTRIARARHEALERGVLRRADAVVTVSWHLSREYEKIRQRDVLTITNGFDHPDFEGISPFGTSDFVIGHYGTFGEDRNPKALWNALNLLMLTEPGFSDRMSVLLAGPTDSSVLEAAKNSSFGNRVTHLPYLSHREAIGRMLGSGLLVVILNQNKNEEGRVTGKIFEYVASGRPVLGIGSVTSDCARVIRETGCGLMLPFGDEVGIRSFISDVFSGRFKLPAGELNHADEFSRRALTAKMATAFNSLLYGEV